MRRAERERRLGALAGEIRVCTQCRLCESRRHAVPGEGPADAALLWLGEAPGAEEDEQGRPFVGASGRMLRSIMLAVGLDPGAAYITNVVKCRPPKNRPPRADEVAICTSLYLARQVELVAPGGIVALGASAGAAILADKLKLTEEHGTWRRDYDLTNVDVPVYVTYHPAAALRSARWRDELRADMRQLSETWARHVHGQSIGKG
ncbi:MAG: uracil-DNA glycosylase [Anaerolineae bacterium]